MVWSDIVPRGVAKFRHGSRLHDWLCWLCWLVRNVLSSMPSRVCLVNCPFRSIDATRVSVDTSGVVACGSGCARPGVTRGAALGSRPTPAPAPPCVALGNGAQFTCAAITDYVSIHSMLTEDAIRDFARTLTVLLNSTSVWYCY